MAKSASSRAEGRTCAAHSRATTPAPPSIPPLTRTAASRMALTLGARPGREDPLRAPRMILKPALRNASRALNPRAEVSVPLG
ncbi:hypothetical protein GCM10010336_41680 [Streptomyces goshikiensis]|nr:hypothetical protein GCM10010336_41680 [Streptomyces goshikiensis]